MTTVTVDDQHQVMPPDAKPGQVFAYECEPDGTIKLVPVPGPRRIFTKLANKDRAMLFELPDGYQLAPEAIAQAVAEERESRA